MSPARERRLRRVTPVLLVVGVLLMVVFDRTLTLLAGVALMLAFVVCGTFLIAAPGFLDGDGLDGEDVARGATGEDAPGEAGGEDRSGGAPGGTPTAGEGDRGSAPGGASV
ncbi:hypothetical protein [Patulibacter sp. SYSU D01012]|uniref:hypothetical protein n=1 Tax=Patulibacter sp. SYSU D01012 TaxID=2817381 RepID=UPI001B3016A9|nr:hypothetical protein [Patulibacter sp. SYSU D01012]